MLETSGMARPHYADIFERVARMSPAQFEERRQIADLSFLAQRIASTVYADGRGTERLFPFELMPSVQQIGGLQ